MTGLIFFPGRRNPFFLLQCYLVEGWEPEHEGDKDFMDTYKRRIKPLNSIVPSVTSKPRMVRYLRRINTRPCGE